MTRKILCTVFSLFVVLSGCGLFAAEDAAPDRSLNPLVDIDPYEEDVDDDSDEAAETEIADNEPMDPALDRPGKRRFRPGTLLELWLLKPGQKFVRMPGDPSLTGMVDDSKQYFYAGTMLRDPEMKNYGDRQGVLQWTTYFRAVRAGKHVFALSAAGLDKPDVQYAGVSLVINDEVKIQTPGSLDDSAVADFAAPGWYKLQVRLWWTYPEKPVFEDYNITLKVKEPGSLSLRQLNRKELFYLHP